MSTEVALFNGKVPAYLKGVELDATTKALAGTGGANRRISIKGSVFRMIVNGEQMAENEDRQMNIVVVAASPYVNRQFYSTIFEEDKISSPDCWSVDGKTPDPASEHIQSASCDTCKQNIAGSGQGDSRACRYQQRLAVVLEGEIDGPVYQLALPATSLFGKGEANSTKLPLQAYARYLAQNGTPITAVVTEMKFDTKAATPKLTFKPVRPLTEDEYATSVEQGSSMDAQQAIKLTVFQQDKKEKPVAAAKALVDEPAEVEPKKAPAAAKPTAPPAKRPVAEVIAEWDEA